MSPKPVKLGILIDGPEISELGVRGMTLKVEQVNDDGGVWGRPVELVFATADAAYEGLPDNTVGAWLELAADTEVVGIIGPAITANTLAIVDLVDQHKVPTIHWGGTERAKGEWYFQYQLDSLSNDGPFLLRLMEAHGHRRVGVLHTHSAEGDEIYEYFEREAQLGGFQIVAHEMVGFHQEDVLPEMTRIKEQSPDAAVMLGWHSLPFARAMKALQWRVPRYGTITFFRITSEPDLVADNEGLLYWADQYEPRNPAVIAIREAWRARFGEDAPDHIGPYCHYDLVTLMVEGLKRAPNVSRAGLKVGLERVHQLPCASGGRNPVMGYSPGDRQAIKGPDLLMYRTIRDGCPVTYEL